MKPRRAGASTGDTVGEGVARWKAPCARLRTGRIHIGYRGMEFPAYARPKEAGGRPCSRTSLLSEPRAHAKRWALNRTMGQSPGRSTSRGPKGAISARPMRNGRQPWKKWRSWPRLFAGKSRSERKTPPLRLAGDQAGSLGVSQLSNYYRQAVRRPRGCSTVAISTPVAAIPQLRRGIVLGAICSADRSRRASAWPMLIERVRRSDDDSRRAGVSYPEGARVGVSKTWE